MPLLVTEKLYKARRNINEFSTQHIGFFAGTLAYLRWWWLIRSLYSSLLIICMSIVRVIVVVVAAIIVKPLAEFESKKRGVIYFELPAIKR